MPALAARLAEVALTALVTGIVAQILDDLD